MRNSTNIWLIVIGAITILALYMIWPNNPGFGPDKPIVIHPGLDVQGGLRVLLAADPGVKIDAGAMDQARQIIDRRVNGLGVSEPVVQVSGNNRILVELPGIADPKAAIDTIKQTGLLEFVDFSTTGTCTASMPSAGAYIFTDRQAQLRGNAPAVATGTPTTGPTSTTAEATAPATKVPTVQPTSTPTPTVMPTPTAQQIGIAYRPHRDQATPEATAAATQAATAAATAQPSTPVPAGGDGTKEHPFINPCTNTPFTTVMTGAGLQTATGGPGGQTQTQWVVNFTLATNDEATRFATHTSTHVGKVMAIVLDGQVLSAPTIQQALTTGGVITGNFTQQQANDLALQLRYGALPIPLHIESQELVGASLGSESIRASLIAGLIGIVVVLIFMLAYYRIPGLAADLALLLFAAINFALYKFIPVTLTLPAMIGFMISIGTAVDGNILIFERIKEELRNGRTGEKAIDLGFARAWPSIRDSNISTIIVALIVYFFGATFGAGTVRGFAITLILGLITNLFTAIIVTRTFLNVFMAIGGDRARRFGLFGHFAKSEE
jgi:protein-export membrane protein SecD